MHHAPSIGTLVTGQGDSPRTGEIIAPPPGFDMPDAQHVWVRWNKTDDDRFDYLAHMEAVTDIDPVRPEQDYIDKTIAAIENVDRTDRSDYYVQAFMIASGGTPVAILHWHEGEFLRTTTAALIGELTTTLPEQL